MSVHQVLAARRRTSLKKTCCRPHLRLARRRASLKKNYCRPHLRLARRGFFQRAGLTGLAGLLLIIAAGNSANADEMQRIPLRVADAGDLTEQ